MKVDVLLCTYNKEMVLANTLYGLSRQKSQHEITFNIYDDASKIPPDAIIERFLPQAKYYRAEKNSGGRHAELVGYEMLKPGGDVIVVMSSDVYLVDDNVIDEMVNNVGAGFPVLCSVANASLVPNSWEHHDVIMNQINTFWDEIYVGANVYQGPKRVDGFIFYFCAAFWHWDIVRLWEHGLGCDLQLNMAAMAFKLQHRFVDNVRAIHQGHPFVQHPCKEIGTCGLSDYCVERGVKPFAK